MKEYRILFDYRPGTKTQVPEYVFVELEDETGKSTGAGAWEGHPQPEVRKGSLVYLVLPNYKEERDRLIELSKQVNKAASGLRGYIMDGGSTSFFHALDRLNAEIKEMQPEEAA